jgi:hypothetical protein
MVLVKLIILYRSNTENTADLIFNTRPNSNNYRFPTVVLFSSKVFYKTAKDAGVKKLLSPPTTKIHGLVNVGL